MKAINTFLILLFQLILGPIVISAQEISYNYDSQGRLILITTNDGICFNYGYDEVGNQITRTTSYFSITRTWTGAIDDDWNKPGNWNPNGVPRNIDDVAIPASSPYMPVVKNMGLGCHKINLEAGALLNINPGFTLTVNGKEVSK